MERIGVVEEVLEVTNKSETTDERGVEVDEYQKTTRSPRPRAHDELQR